MAQNNSSSLFLFSKEGRALDVPALLFDESAKITSLFACNLL
jgi:hypothetical protein